MCDGEYPDDYPDNCPPEIEEDIHGLFIRLVPRRDRIKPKDFRSSFDSNNLHVEAIHDKCSQHAISLFKEKNDAIDFIDTHPKTHKKYLVFLEIPENSGVIKNCIEEGRKSHHNWWIPLRVDPTAVPIDRFEGPFPGE